MFNVVYQQLTIRKKALHKLGVTSLEKFTAAQMTFTLCGLLREDVTLVRSEELDLALLRDLKTLTRSAVRLHLWHDVISSLYVVNYQSEVV